MKLYHGTNIDFDVIDLAKSNKYKDFGQGFYLTDIRSQAEQLAAKKSRIFGGYPIIQEYEFDESMLESNELKILMFDTPTTEWPSSSSRIEIEMPTSSTITTSLLAQSPMMEWLIFWDVTKKVLLALRN